MQSTQPERKSDKEKLFARIRNEKVTLFIGSGFSLTAGAPSANAIVETIKTVCPEIQKTELKDVAEEYVQPTPHWIVAETGRLLLDVYDEKIPFEENE